MAFALDTDGTLRKTFTLEALKSLQDRDEFKDTLSGATLIVDARLGGLKDGLLDDNVSDLPPTADANNWLGESVVGFRIRSTDAPEAAPRDPNWRERFRFACEVSEEGQPSRWLAWTNGGMMRNRGGPGRGESAASRRTSRARGTARSRTRQGSRPHPRI